MRPAPRDYQQKSRAERISGIARSQHLAPVEAVRGMAGNQKQKNTGKKLRQPHEPQVEGAFRDVIHLPSHGNRLHFDGSHNEEARNLKQHKVGMREGDASSFGVGGGGH